MSNTMCFWNKVSRSGDVMIGPLTVRAKVAAYKTPDYYSAAYVTSRGWTIRTSAADNEWRSVCWSPELGLFVAVSTNGTGNRVMTSPMNDCVRRQGDTMTGNLVTQALSATTGAFSDNITMAATKTVDGVDISGLDRLFIKAGHYIGDGNDNREIDISVDMLSKYRKFLLIKCTDGANKAVFRHHWHTGDACSAFDDVQDYSDHIQAWTANGFQVGANARVNAVDKTYFYFVIWTDSTFST